MLHDIGRVRMTGISKPHYGAMVRWATLLWCLVNVLGCTRVITIEPPEVGLHSAQIVDPETTGVYWWDIGLSIARGDEGDTFWHVDTLIADQVFSPILSELGPQIEVWRFHRRAAHDERGHLFRFYFYTDPATARLVNQRIEDSSLVGWLRDEKVIKRVRPAPADAPTKPALGDRSDPGWPPEIKASWPYFAMGVSQTWLALIGQARAASPPSAPLTPENLLSYYERINERVTLLWREQAQHAYLHHLSALFGYQPVLIRNSVLTRF